MSNYESFKENHPLLAEPESLYTALQRATQTLRILGFTTQEISHILSGEQGKAIMGYAARHNEEGHNVN